MPRDKNPSLSRTCLICRQKLINHLKVTGNNRWATLDPADLSPQKHSNNPSSNCKEEGAAKISQWKTLLLEALSMLFGLPANHPFITVFTPTPVTSLERDPEDQEEVISGGGAKDIEGQMCNRCLEDVSNVHYIFWQLHNLEEKLSQLQLLLFQRLRSNYDALPVGLIFGKFVGFDDLLNQDLSNLKYDDLVKFLFEEIKSSREAWPKPTHSPRWKQARQNAKRVTQTIFPEDQLPSTGKDTPTSPQLLFPDLSSTEGHQLVKIEVDPADFPQSYLPPDTVKASAEEEKVITPTAILPLRPPSQRKSAQKAAVKVEDYADVKGEEEDDDDHEYDADILEMEHQLLEEDADLEEEWEGPKQRRGRTKVKSKTAKQSVAPRKSNFTAKKKKGGGRERNARYLCTEDPDNCSKTYGNKKHLRDHIEKYHKARKYSCDEPDCLEKFKTEALLESHLEKHHDKPKPKEICELCGLALDHKEMKRHYYFRHQGIGKFKCERCSMDFMDPADFEEHEQLHENAEFPFQCVVCQQVFTNSMDLKNHVTSNHLSSGLKCPICGIMKPNDFLLQRHIRIHDRVKRFSCSQCDKQFSTNAYLKYHEDHFHTNVGRKFPCEVCGKEFLHEKNVMRHLISHREEKPFKCRICPKTFNYSHLLKKHEEIHSGTKNYECHLCGKRFKQEQNLKQHMRSHRPKPEKEDGASGTLGVGTTSRKKTVLKLEEEEEDAGEISYEIHQDGDCDAIPVILQVKSDPMLELEHHHVIATTTSTLTPHGEGTGEGEMESVIEATIIPASDMTEEELGHPTGQYETVQEIQLHPHDGSGELGQSGQTATVVFLYEYNA